MFEDEKQPLESNSMKHEEAARTLEEAAEEKSRTTSEIRQNRTGQFVPGHSDGESRQKVEMIEEEINVPPKNHFHVHFICFLLLSFIYLVALSLV